MLTRWTPGLTFASAAAPMMPGGIGGQRCGEDEMLAAGEQFVERHQRHARHRGGAPAVGDDGHPERRRQRGDAPADLADAEQAERLAVERAERVGDDLGLRRPRAIGDDHRRQPFLDHQQRRHDEFGDRRGAGPGRRGDDRAVAEPFGIAVAARRGELDELDPARPAGGAGYVMRGRVGRAVQGEDDVDVGRQVPAARQVERARLGDSGVGGEQATRGGAEVVGDMELGHPRSMRRRRKRFNRRAWPLPHRPIRVRRRRPTATTRYSPPTGRSRRPTRATSLPCRPRGARNSC